MSDLPTPDIVDRVAWQRKIDELLLREKAHTREADAIAAARRRLPMVEVDASTPVVGAHGEVPLIDVFEGRSQPRSMRSSPAGISGCGSAACATMTESSRHTGPPPAAAS